MTVEEEFVFTNSHDMWLKQSTDEDEMIFTFAPDIDVAKSLPANRTGEQLQEGARQWQAEGYATWLGLDNKRMGTWVATGAGKTRLAITVTHNWLHEHEPHPVIIFYVPTKALLNQTRTVFRMWGLTVGRIGGGYNERSPNKDVYITTYLSAKKIPNIKHLQNRKKLLILDECHLAGGEGALKHFRNFQGDACLLLSATPHRSDGICVMCEMNTSPKNHVCQGDETCVAGIHCHVKLIEGIRQSRTDDDQLDYTFHLIKIKMTDAEQLEYDELTEQISKLYWKCYKAADETAGANKHNLFDRRNFKVGGLLNEVVSYSQAGKPMTILHMYQYLCNKRKRLMNDMQNRFTAAQDILNENIGKKGLLFHETIFGIERLNGMCKNLGIHPHIYHSGLSTLPANVYETYPELNNAGFKRRLAQYSEDATKELKRWERSSSDILLSCKSLKVGFNAPDIDYLVMMTGTNNVGSRIQTIGRVFRGSKHKDIYMFVYDNEEGGDMKCFYKLIHDTGIDEEPEKIRVHIYDSE
tara:strand:+ start:1917 stop:3491 length:1575 start_codon:yes stop_codon:yes gene_type:complete